MMPFETKAPGASLGGLTKYRERETLRRALSGTVATRRQHVLQRHDIARLLDAGGRKQRGKQIPCGGLLRRVHLFEPQARLDVAGGAKIIPVAPFGAVP